VEKALGCCSTRRRSPELRRLKDRLLAKSGSFITTVVRESPPREGKDGLVSMTTEAVVNVKALQKSLNQMSRDERIELIRAGGDPKIAVRIVVRDADAPNAPGQASPVAENLLKERIKSFGFRTWSDDGGASGQVANFGVLGEAQVKKLSLKLEASGVVVTKYTLASWTVKCLDRDTGEELYYNTALPKGVGSWPSEGEALKAIGTRIADEFTRDFFLQHLNVTGRKVTLNVEGLPSAAAADELGRELPGLPAVISAHARPAKDLRTFDLQMVGSGAEGDLVASGILKPLNAKLGQACFGLGAVAGDSVTVVFDRKCADAAIVSRFETYPPAGLYGAPPGRQKG
jgi:serine/threonine-protein kinase